MSNKDLMRIQSLIPKGTEISQDLIPKLLEIDLIDQIVEIHNSKEFEIFLENYEEENEGLTLSKTGDFFYRQSFFIANLYW
jgi:hypothetical protein